MKPTLNLIPIFFLSLIGCTEKVEEIKNNLSPRIFAITVSDMEKSMDWYTSTLHFERDTVMSFPSSGITVGMMHMGEFYIELVSFQNSIPKSALDLPKDYSNLHGFFKIGFQAENIEALFEEMSAKDINIVAPLDALPAIRNYDWPDQYFLITDPDGNYIQFFSKTEASTFHEPLHPFLMALSTADIYASQEWYKAHVGMIQLGEKIGAMGNERALLERDGFVLELGQFEDDRSFDSLSAPEGIWRSKVHGITKLSFLVNDIQAPYQQLKSADALFDFDLTERKSMAGDRYFMIQDNSGASLQFFELDK